MPDTLLGPGRQQLTSTHDPFSEKAFTGWRQPVKGFTSGEGRIALCIVTGGMEDRMVEGQVNL